MKDGTYSVIERKALDKIIAEQNFSNSDRANPTSAARLGKLLGVDAIIVGSVTQFGSDTKNTNVGGGGGDWGGYGLGGVGHKNTKAIVGLDARIVDIDTAEILGVAEGHGESSRSSTSLLGGGGNWHGWGGGNVDFGDSNFQDTIIGEAVNKAVTQMSARRDCGQCETASAHCEGRRPGCRRGRRAGDSERGRECRFKVGDQLSIERVTKVIKDPATREVIRKIVYVAGNRRGHRRRRGVFCLPGRFRVGFPGGRRGQNRHAVGFFFEVQKFPGSRFHPGPGSFSSTRSILVRTCELSLVRQSGMLPCFFFGFESRLFSRARNAVMSRARVSCGWMTASM